MRIFAVLITCVTLTLFLSLAALVLSLLLQMKTCLGKSDFGRDRPCYPWQRVFFVAVFFIVVPSVPSSLGEGCTMALDVRMGIQVSKARVLGVKLATINLAWVFP